jgi:hypothetical protein
MLDALFWYTGFIAWIIIVFGWLSMLYGAVRDKALAKARNKDD